MSEHHKYEFIAYLCTLGALVIVFFGSMAFATFSPAIIGKIEAFGLGTITGGLIGLLRMPRHTPEQSQQAPNELDLTGSQVGE